MIVTRDETGAYDRECSCGYHLQVVITNTSTPVFPYVGSFAGPCARPSRWLTR